MALVFISYCRESQEKARSLAQDLEAMGHQVWLDQALTGGQAWWNLILTEIAKCDVFVFAVDTDSLESPPCKLEYTYASKLGKNILPVLVADGVNLGLLPATLAEIQYVDYRREDREAFRALVKAINKLPPPAPLPDPLPEGPPAPVSYLSGLRERVEGPQGLSFEEQTGVVVRLKHALREPKHADDVRNLLRQFRSRDDLFARVADEIDSLLASPGAGAGASVPPGASHLTDNLPKPTPATEKVIEAKVAPETKLPDSGEPAVSKDKPSTPTGGLSEVLSLKQIWICLLGGLLIAAGLSQVLRTFDGYGFSMNPVGLITSPSWSLAAAVLLCMTVVWRKMAFRPLYKKIVLTVLPFLLGFAALWSYLPLWEMGFLGALVSLLFVIAVLWPGTRSRPVPLKIALVALAASIAVLILFRLNYGDYYPIIHSLEILLGLAFVVCILIMLSKFLGARPRRPADH